MSLDGEEHVPAWAIFEDTTFLVKPQQWEIDDGILVPGHRFLPFHSFQLASPDLTLLMDNSEETSSKASAAENASFVSTPRRTLGVPLSRAVIFYTLFGQEALVPLIGMEDEMNARVDFQDAENALVRLSVFDMGDFYRNSAFVAGDYLECRTLDWEEGVFAGEHRRAADITPEVRDNWRRAMEGAFDTMFQFVGRPMDIPAQLQYAYLFGFSQDEDTLADPGGTIGELLEADNTLRFISTGTNSSAIWHSRETPDMQFDPETFTHVPEGITGDLGAILDDIGSSLTAGETEAFMRDALYHGHRKNHAVTRAFSGTQITCAHEEQEQALHRELDKLWRRVSRTYVPAEDALMGPIRSRFLALYEKQLHWIRSLDARKMHPADLPMESMHEVGEFFGMITATVELLNHPEGGDRESLEGINEQLPMLESAGEEILERAEEAVRAAMNRGT